MSFVNYTVTNRIAAITLNRPDKRNALNYEVVGELKQAFSKAERDDSVKVIVLKAEGNVFSAGADLEYLKKLQQNSYEENLADSAHLMELFKLIYLNKKLVIAQVEGSAIAGGCGLATVCDFVFTVPEAKFGYTEVKIGFIPAIVSVFLTRKIGEGRAKELFLSGKLIDAAEAKKIGMVNVICEVNQIKQEVNAFALKVCEETSAQSITLTKQLISKVQELPLDEALNHASAQNAQARSTDDCKKGISAFIAKEKLIW